MWALRRLPFQRWPGHHLRLPMGRARALQATLAATLKGPYGSRSTLARRIVDHVAAARPTRALRVATDGGSAPQTFVRALPTNVAVVGRCLRTAKLSPLPPTRVQGQRGAPRKKGALLGSPTTVATPAPSGHPHPQAAATCSPSWVGLGHSVFPGPPMRVVVVWRPPRADSKKPQGQKTFGRLKPLEACCSTEVSRSAHTIVETYAERWAMAIAIRDGQAYDGVAQDQGRQCERMVGATTLRLLLAAARPWWCIVTSEPHADMALQRLRP